MSVLPYIQGQAMNLTVATNGYVGVGTSQPMKRLHVEGDIYSNGTLTASNLVVVGDYVFLNTLTSNIDPVVIRNERAGPALKVSQAGQGISYAIAEFYDNETGIALKIADGGNIGIGTNTPQYKMDVIGDIRGACIFANASNVTGLAPSAKIDTTNATNITSGTLAKDRVASVLNPTSFQGAVGIGSTTAVNMVDVVGGTFISPPQFPPRPMTSVNNNITNAAITKFNGSYIASASFDQNKAHLAFDRNSTTFWATNLSYNPTFDPSLGDRITTDAATDTTYFGHWIQLGLPSQVFLYNYVIQRPTNFVNTPSSWTVFGSRNTSEWYAIHNVDNYPWTINVTSATFTVNAYASYQYFRLVIQKAAAFSGTNNPVHIPEWQLYGDNVPYVGLKTIGPLEVNKSASETVMYVNANGVGIGTKAPQETLHLANGNLRIDYLAGVGTRTVVVDQNGVLTFAVSDERMKEDITPLQYGLYQIEQLNPVSFYWKNKQRYGEQKEIGMIAQDVEKVIPQAVYHVTDQNLYAMDYTKLIPVLVQSIKDLAYEVRELKKSCTQI